MAPSPYKRPWQAELTKVPRTRAAYGTFSRARQEGKDLSRRSLIDASCDLALQMGTHAVTIDKIVAHAKLSRPTFYLHFKSRDDLFAAMRRQMVETLDQLYDLLGTIDARDPSTLRDWILRMLATCRRDRKLILTLMRTDTASGAAGFDPTAYYDSVIARLAPGIARFRAAQNDRAVHAEALLLLIQLEGVIRHVAVKEDDSEDRRFAEPITRNFVRFLDGT